MEGKGSAGTARCCTGPCWKEGGPGVQPEESLLGLSPALTGSNTPGTPASHMPDMLEPPPSASPVTCSPAVRRAECSSATRAEAAERKGLALGGRRQSQGTGMQAGGCLCHSHAHYQGPKPSLACPTSLPDWWAGACWEGGTAGVASSSPCEAMNLMAAVQKPSCFLRGGVRPWDAVGFLFLLAGSSSPVGGGRTQAKVDS